MAYATGQIVGLLILGVIIVGLLRTFSRKDLTWREKLVGRSGNKHG